jgi:thiamine pyrophosphokinase
MQNKLTDHRPCPIVILADGQFPTHPIPLSILMSAGHIICCDGAAAKLLDAGLKPDAIVGDMDSLPKALQTEYASIIHKDSEQEYNDLTKAVRFAIEQNPASISIVGATGYQEDHTIGNIALLSYYRTLVDAAAPISDNTSINSDTPIFLYTDTGKFFPITKGVSIDAPIGSNVSIFSLDTNIIIKSKGLRYPLDKVVFDSWWKATLNKTTENPFELIFETGKVILYITYN